MAGFDTRNALNLAIRALTDSAIKRAAGGWIPPKERERQQKEAMRVEEKQARQIEKQQQAQQKQLITDEKERQKNLEAFQKGNHPDVPHVVYHGSANDFSSFDPNRAMSEGGAFYFSKDSGSKPGYGARSAGTYAPRRGGSIYPVHLSMKNPHIVGFTKPEPEDQEGMDKWVEEQEKFDRQFDDERFKARYFRDAIRYAHQNGHDGVIIKNVTDDRYHNPIFSFPSDIFIAFDPSQIKSATGNQGTFDPSNPDITKSEGGPILSKQYPTHYMPNVGRQVMNTGGTPEDLIGYHGSGKQFESFDPSLAGSATGSEYGEAAAYISKEEPVAQEYKQRAEKRMGMLYQGKPVREMRDDGLDSVRAELADRINDGFEPQEALQNRVNHWLYFAKDFRERAEKDPENREKHLQEAKKFEDRANLFAALDPNEFSRHKGSMYQVKVLAHPDHFLDWNKPFSEQSDHVRERLTPVVEQIDKLYNEPRRRRGETISKYDQPQNMSGEKIYRYLQKHSSGDWEKLVDPKKQATNDHKYSTKFLKDRGIRGVTYLDETWDPANPPRNYAVYHPEDLEILKRYASGGSVHVNNASRPKFALGGTNGTDETVASGFSQAPTEEGKLQDAGGLGGSDGNVPAPNQTPAEEALEGLPSKVKIPVTGETLMVGPDPRIRQIARDYMAEAGLPYSPPKKYAKVDPERAGRIAQAFEEMPHDPEHPLVKASYDALIKETMAQYNAAKKAGFKAEFWDPEKEEDPYAASPRMATEDIRKNHHMYVFPTRFGYGSGEPITEEEIRQNPMLKDSGETWNGQPVTVNDIFRAVHDYFGHAKEGVGFRHDGEENAWRAHASMFSPLARMAMTTETRGQNSWLNFGPHGEKNKNARTEDTVFADQKIGVLPPWVTHEGAEDFVRAKDVDAIKKLYDHHFGDRKKRASGGRNGKKHPALSIAGTHIRADKFGEPIFTGSL